MHVPWPIREILHEYIVPNHIGWQDMVACYMRAKMNKTGQSMDQYTCGYDIPGFYRDIVTDGMLIVSVARRRTA